jgi:hypothetical protein
MEGSTQMIGVRYVVFIGEGVLRTHGVLHGRGSWEIKNKRVFLGEIGLRGHVCDHLL